MALAGHETFPVREGWLSKALILLASEDPDRFWADDAADWLGVGRNMAKSIRHWLLATGLAEPTAHSARGKGVPLELTDLGYEVLERDTYMLEPGTWWALHVNVLNSPQAEAWTWFFNHFHPTRFDRATCIQQLRRHLQANRARMPSARTIERDVACLLLSYSRQLPPPRDDPEDACDSPFVRLGLMLHHRTSGHHELLRGPKDVPPALLGYCLARGPLAKACEHGADKHAEITLHDAVYVKNGPGRAFCLDPESLHELAARAEAALGAADFRLHGLAGERNIRIRTMPPHEWLVKHYKTCKMRGVHVA